VIDRFNPAELAEEEGRCAYPLSHGDLSRVNRSATDGG
jgi:hypothetical protein